MSRQVIGVVSQLKRHNDPATLRREAASRVVDRRTWQAVPIFHDPPQSQTGPTDIPARSFAACRSARSRLRTTRPTCIARSSGQAASSSHPCRSPIGHAGRERNQRRTHDPSSRIPPAAASRHRSCPNPAARRHRHPILEEPPNEASTCHEHPPPIGRTLIRPSLLGELSRLLEFTDSRSSLHSRERWDKLRGRCRC